MASRGARRRETAATLREVEKEACEIIEIRKRLEEEIAPSRRALCLATVRRQLIKGTLAPRLAGKVEEVSKVLSRML